MQPMLKCLSSVSTSSSYLIPCGHSLCALHVQPPQEGDQKVPLKQMASLSLLGSLSEHLASFLKTDDGVQGLSLWGLEDQQLLMLWKGAILPSLQRFFKGQWENVGGEVG